MMNVSSKPIAVMVVLGLAATSGAQPTKDAPPAPSSADKPAAKPGAAASSPGTAKKPPAKKPAVEPEAIGALEKMGAFLREQQSFTVHTTMETDQVLQSGQKVQLPSTGDLRVRRPDHLRADVTSDRRQRQLFYDGKTFTMYGQRVGYYATVPAPPTIGELAEEIEERYGIELPLVDLFYWGTDKASLAQIKGAIYVGPSKVGGVDTDHYAFRQPGLDWQIWIERGARPLPRKLVLTSTDDPARPEYSVAMAWDLSVKHDDSLFTFVPPKDSEQIALAEIPAPRSAAPAKAKRQSSRSPR